MLVTFKTKAYANITMFGDVAVALLKLMGHSGTVPGAIEPEDIPRAVERLREGLAHHGGAPAVSSETDENDGQEPVSMSHRALPLIELLEAAAAAGENVMWDN